MPERKRPDFEEETSPESLTDVFEAVLKAAGEVVDVVKQVEYIEYQTTWRDISIIIRHNPCWLSEPGKHQTQHIEVNSALCAPLPITQTGYRSIFLTGDSALIDYNNNPVAYVLAYLDTEAEKPTWKTQVEAARQLSLF